MPLIFNMHRTTIRRTLQVLGLLAAMATLAGCSTLQALQALQGRPEFQAQPAQEAAVLPGSSSRNNTTPMEPAFACMAKAYSALKVPVVSITVGDVKDYTGKYSQAEGNAITQGGSLMLYSALGKMGNAVRLQERFDTRIGELELAYADRRQLGDGKLHAVEAGKPAVPWVPYFGGSIMRSDYYIVGGITEVNYNIQSRGAELNVSNIGGKVRTFTMNVGVDLRIVDTRSLIVVKTVSMQKQITGTEVGAGIFRFFGTNLLDVNMGSKNQEPLQLGVRTTIEHGLLELLGAVSGLNPQPCVDYSLKGLPTDEKMQAAVAATTEPVQPAPVLAPLVLMAPTQPQVQTQPPAPETLKPAVPAEPSDAGKDVAIQAIQAIKDMPLPVPVNAAQNAGKGGGNGSTSINFEPNSAVLDGAALNALNSMAVGLAADKTKTLQLELLTRETENLPSAQRRQLAQDRVKAVSDALVAAGLPAGRIAVDWLPDTSSAIQRQGAGMQVVARLKLTEAKAGVGW